MKISRKKLRTLILREISMGVRGPTVPKSVPMTLEKRIKLDMRIFKGIEDFISKFDRWAVSWQNYIRAPWYNHRRTNMIKSHYDALKKEKQKIASSQGTDYNVAVMISSLLEISKSFKQQFKSRPTDELVVLSQKIATALTDSN